MIKYKKNWFRTLNDALASEDLLEAWEIHFEPIHYGKTFAWTWQDGSKHGRFISVHRNSDGWYERPVHYAR